MYKTQNIRTGLFDCDVIICTCIYYIYNTKTQLMFVLFTQVSTFNHRNIKRKAKFLKESLKTYYEVSNKIELCLLEFQRICML